MDIASTYLDIYWINVGFLSSFSAKFFLITWSFVYIYSVHDVSWSKTISKCAVLFSVMALGYGIGSTYFSRYIGKLSGLIVYRWTFLSVCLLLLSIVTKFSLIAVICGMIGLLVGSTVASISRHLRNRNMKSTLLYNPNVVDDVSLTNMKYQTMSLCFCPLFIILLYDPAYDAKFPALLPSLVYAWTCLIVLFLHLKLYEWFRSDKGIGSGSITGPGEDAAGVTGTAVVKPPTAKLAPYTGSIPKAFLTFNGNETKARAAVNAMLQWRADNNIDDIQTAYQPFFDDILRNYPHFMHGRAKDGSIIVYELVGKANLEGLKNAGMTIDNMAHHFTLRNEMLAKRFLDLDYSAAGVSSSELAHDEPKQLVAILDCDGISMDKISFVDIMSFIAKTSFVLDNYYPTMVQRVLIVNASYAFQYAWGFASSVLPQALKNKLSFPPLEGLNEFIDPSERPRQYGGTSNLELGDHEIHKAFMELPTHWVKPEDSLRVYSGGGGDSPVDAEDEDRYDEGGKSEGLFSKLFNVLSGKSTSNGHDQQSRSEGPTQAHLGGELSLVFDKTLNRWVSVPDRRSTRRNSETTPILRKGSGSSGGAGDGSSDTDSSDEFFDTQETAAGVESEATVIQAIEAAHFAKAAMRDNSGAAINGNHHTAALTESALRRTSSGRGQLLGQKGDMGAVPQPRNSANSNSNSNGDSSDVTPPSAQMLVITFVFQFLTSLMFHGLIFILPAFCLTPSYRGGLNYTLTDLGLVMSTTGMCLFALFLSVLQPKCAAMTKLSPVRTLRIGMGIMILALFFLPILCSSKDPHSSGRSDVQLMMEVDDWKAMHPDYLKTTVLHPSVSLNSASVTEVGSGGSSASSWSLWAVIKLPWTILMLLLNHTPCQSIFGLFIPSLLLSSIIAASHLSRRASTLISYSTLLNSSLTVNVGSLKSLFSFIDHFAAVLAPLVLAGVFGSTYHLHYSYPRDASHSLFVIIAIAMFVYISTLLIHVQFRGDFGILIDQDNRSSNSSGTANAAGEEEDGGGDEESGLSKYRSKRSAFDQKFELNASASASESLQQYSDNTCLYYTCSCCQMCCSSASSKKMMEIVGADIQLLRSTFSSQRHAYPISQQLRTGGVRDV